MRKLNEDGSKKRLFHHIKRLMRKEERRKKIIKVLNDSGNIVTDEQGVKRSGEFLGQTVWYKLDCNTRSKKGDEWKCYDKW